MGNPLKAAKKAVSKVTKAVGFAANKLNPGNILSTVGSVANGALNVAGKGLGAITGALGMGPPNVNIPEAQPIIPPGGNPDAALTDRGANISIGTTVMSMAGQQNVDGLFSGQQSRAGSQLGGLGQNGLNIR